LSLSIGDFPPLFAPYINAGGDIVLA